METIRKHKELFCALGAIIICAVLILVWREYDRTFIARDESLICEVALKKAPDDWDAAGEAVLTALGEPYISGDSAVLFLYDESGNVGAAEFTREEAGWRYKYIYKTTDGRSHGRILLPPSSTGPTTAVYVVSDSIRYISYELYGEEVTVEVDRLPFVYILPEDYENRRFLDADGNVVGH